MGQSQNAAKMNRKNDKLIELPDGILSTIISMLTFKEAVRTSVLSKQWRFIWTRHSDLWFDCSIVLGSVIFSNRYRSLSKLEIQLQRSKFVDQVSQVMHQRCKGTKVDSFALHFPLCKDSAPHIDCWIGSAMRKGVENIDLDLSESCDFYLDHSSSTALEKYEFPTGLLAAAGKKCMVKHLQLASCSLIAPLNSNSLISLVTIHLENVNICDEQMDSLLSSCLLLEGLSLHLCEDLVGLNLVAPNLRLKRVTVRYCSRLQKMELRAKNLVLFEYTGHLIFFYFRNVPRLAEAFLHFAADISADGATYALTRFARDVPQLETLNLVSLLATKMLKLPETIHTFTNIKQLVLTVFPFHDEDKLCWISYVLKNFPFLHKLQLNLFCPNFIKPPKEVERVLPKCPHYHLTELEINGFHGNRHEEELLQYLLDNLVELKAVTVSPCQKVYRGFNSFVYERPHSWYKSRIKSVCEWLRAVVPPTVLLQML